MAEVVRKWPHDAPPRISGLAQAIGIPMMIDLEALADARIDIARDILRTVTTRPATVFVVNSGHVARA